MVWVYLHILTLFAAVGVALSSEIILHRAAGTGDVRSIRTAFGLAKPLEPIIPVLFTLGGILGFIAVLVRKYGFFESWMVQSYVIFGIALVLGGAIQGPWIGKVRQAAESSPDDLPSDELQRLLNNRKARYAFWVLYLAVVVVIYIMVIKPYSYGKGFY